jgi:hypothetical protein
VKDNYTKLEVIEMLKLIVDANDRLQDWIDQKGAPSTLLKFASDLDWAIRNVGK